MSIPYSLLFNDWGLDTSKIRSINDIRLRFLPFVEEKKTCRSISFTRDNCTYYVKTNQSFSKGTNGRVYPAYRIEENRGRRYLHMIVKKMPLRLNSLREAVIQRIAQEFVSTNVPTVYATFRSKNYLWVFMQDLRTPIGSATKAQSLHNWLNTDVFKMKTDELNTSFRLVLKTIFDILFQLHVALEFKHGDLHPANIFIHTDDTGTKIHRIFLLDFGYSMIKDSQQNHCASPYWSSYKNGVDSAVLLWSLWSNTSLQKKLPSDVRLWIMNHMPSDLLPTTDISKLYQQIQNRNSNELTTLHIETVYRDFPRC